MTMVRSIAPHALDLTGGSILAIGQVANLDLSNPHEANYYDNGWLVITDGSVPPVPPSPPTPIEAVGAPFVAGDLIYYNGIDWDIIRAVGTGKVLQSNGAASPPSWGSVDLAELGFDPATQTELDAAMATIVPLQAPTSQAKATAALATNARESGTIALYKGYRVRRVTTDRAARVRLYTSVAKRDADAARPLAVDPIDYPTANSSPDHGCALEVVTDATHLDLPIAPNVSAHESTGSNNIPITIDNFGALGVVNVTIYYQRIEP